MLIGLNGNMQVGKDTVCQVMQSYLHDTVRMAFADKLKDSLCALLDIDREALEDMKCDPTSEIILRKKGFPKRSMTVRQAMQRYGTEAHRNIFGDNFWVEALLPMYSDARLCYKDRLYVITDARFENELQRIKNFGGITVRIERPGFLPSDAHASEVVPNSRLIDYTLINDGSLLELSDKVGRLLMELQIIPRVEVVE